MSGAGPTAAAAIVVDVAMYLLSLPGGDPPVGRSGGIILRQLDTLPS